MKSERTAGWCRKHNDLAWGYQDGSITCMYQLVVESSSMGCEFVPGPIPLADGGEVTDDK